MSKTAKCVANTTIDGAVFLTAPTRVNVHGIIPKRYFLRVIC